MRADGFHDKDSSALAGADGGPGASGSSLGISGPLRMVTLVSGDLAACRRFYTDVLQMRELGSVGTSRELEDLQALQAQLWALPAGSRWRAAHFISPGLVGVPVLRILEFEQPGPPVRPGFEIRLDGGAGVGFAVSDPAVAERVAAEHGFEVTAHATRVPVHRGDGTSHLVLESVFRAPDEVYAFGIARVAPQPPVGPIAPGFNVGGLAYSSMVARGSQHVVDFFVEVLDFQVVRDYVMRGEEPEDVLKLPSGTRMRFAQMYARGASSGYLVVVDFMEGGRPNPAPPGPPRCGVAMWSFRVRDLDAVMARVRAFAARGGAAGRAEVLAGPLQVPMPFGVRRVASVRIVGGLLVELMEV